MCPKFPTTCLPDPTYLPLPPLPAYLSSLLAVYTRNKHACIYLPTETNPTGGQSFFGALGCACAIIFTVFGASYGTAKSAGAIFSSGIIRPDRLMQNT